MTETSGRNWKNADTFVIDQEGIFVSSVSRAAILYDTQKPGRNLVLYSVIQQDDTVGNVFFQAVTAQLTFAAFTGDDCGDVFLFQPGKQPTQLAAQDCGVRQPRKQVFNCIEHNPFGADLVDGMSKPDKQSFKVVFPALFMIPAFDLHMIDDQFLRSNEPA